LERKGRNKVAVSFAVNLLFLTELLFSVENGGREIPPNHPNHPLPPNKKVMSERALNTQPPTIPPALPLLFRPEYNRYK